LWFVSLLCIFILITPLLLQWPDRPVFLLAVIFVGTFATALLASTVPGVDARIAMYFPAYCAGIALAQGRLQASLLTLAVVFAVCVAVALPLTNALPGQVRAMPMAVSGAMLILAATRRWEAQIPDWRIVPILGSASYFMYLFHRPALELLMPLRQTPRGGLALLWLVAVPLIVLIANWGQSRYDRLR
jgi:peptidoglycan/LPS O-acetylase OafA/YrhL